MTNERHKNDGLMDKMKKRMSNTEKLEKLTEIFPKRKADSKGNKNIDCQNFVYHFDFQILGRSGP